MVRNDKIKQVSEKQVLFICTHNSARSQMAEGLLKFLYGNRYEVYSAGTEPSNVNPYAVNVMAEIGIGISKHSSKNIEEFRGRKFDYVVTVSDHGKENCPFFSGGDKYIHKGFEDPAKFSGIEDEILSVFRCVRNATKDWIEKTFGEENE